MFNKPFLVLSQFTSDGSANAPLSQFRFPENVYPIGRLDADSEGLLLLSDEAKWNDRILNPKREHPRTYWAQVERIPTQESLNTMMKGVTIQGYKTKPCTALLLNPQPEIEPRNPPIRYRANVPDCWIELTLTEGKNRQVRKMTAAIGHPTLRLIRKKIGKLELSDLEVGKWRELTSQEISLLLM